MYDDSDNMPCCAVFVEDDDGSYHAISFGDSEFECKAWLNDHPFFSQNYTVFIGYQYQIVL